MSAQTFRLQGRLSFPLQVLDALLSALRIHNVK